MAGEYVLYECGRLGMNDKCCSRKHGNTEEREEQKQ